MEEPTKKVMVTIRKAPHGTYYMQEALDAIFIISSYNMKLSVLFSDDGILALKNNQNTKPIGTKGFMASLGALADWGITRVYADGNSMRDRGIVPDMLVSIGSDDDTDETLWPIVLSSEQAADLMNRQDVVLSF